MTLRGEQPLLDRRLVLALGGYATFAFALYATWLAVTVVAYERGGADETGLVGAALLVPGALGAPLFGAVADRVRRDVVLIVGYAGFGLATLATAVAIDADAGRLPVYGAAAIATMFTTVPRPVVSALLPAMTDSARALIGASVSLEVVLNLAIFLGPLGAAAVLAAWGPAEVMWAGAGLAGIAVVCTLGLGLGAARSRPAGSVGMGDRRLRFAADLLRGNPHSRLMLVLTVGAFVLSGALDVFFVTTALDGLGRSDRFAALLAAANGLGGFVGAVLAGPLLGRLRRSRLLGLSGVLAAAPLVLLAAADSWLAMVAFLASGVGLGMGLVATRAFLQRATPDSVLARVFGMLEGASLVALALGSLVAGLLAEVATDWGSALLAAACVVGLAGAWPAVRALDHAFPSPHPAVVQVLSADPILGHLPEPQLLRVARNAREVVSQPGDVIIREGEPGDRYYLVRSGTVRVTSAAGEIRLGPGAGFGEVALLRDAPRNATVRAEQPTALVAVGRRVFLEAVTGSVAAAGAAEDLSAQRG